MSEIKERSIESIEYQAWRIEVLKQGGHKCKECGSRKKLHCHHIKEWAIYPELRFEVSNGEILCRSCHIGKHPFMVKYYPLKKKTVKKVWVSKQQKKRNKQERKIKKAQVREQRFSCASRYKKSFGQPKYAYSLPK